jgi:hypothetical protein
MPEFHEGLNRALTYPLFQAIANRRSRRIGKGLLGVRAGSLSYKPTDATAPQPLSPLEEAVLIAATGTTGVTLPDRPFEDDQGQKILGTPNLNMVGRAAGGTDNAQATHFFLINDEGVYLLRRVETPAAFPTTAQEFLDRAAQAKQLVHAGRPQFPRDFPYYLDSNRFLSNVPGSTILFPIVDMTRQYINALMYLLTEPEGHRPIFLDDRNFYFKAGVKSWFRKGPGGETPFLKQDSKLRLPLGVLGSMRTQIEADLLLQNLMLVLQAMGLGGWIHACVAPPYLLGNPHLTTAAEQEQGLRFRWHTPGFRFLDLLRWGTFLPSARAHPVGVEVNGTTLLKGLCPPYYTDMAEAVNEVVEQKYRQPDGVYEDRAYFRSIFRGDGGDRYVSEVPHYDKRVIACVKDVCRYVHQTHGRFPAHVDAMYVPGVWLQAHHLDLDYYDTLFTTGPTPTHRQHQQLWHAGGS